MEKSSSKVHNLSLSYEDYVRGGKSIANTRIDKYIVYDQLGRGAFGAVYKGMHDSTKKTVAIKVLDLFAVEKEPNERVRQIKRRLCKTESQLMMICNSENVVKCFDVYENKWLKIIVMEYCNGGELRNQIHNKVRIPQAEAILILKQIINGIAELHTHKIIHRDLKAQNILSHNGVYKIADMGFSKQQLTEEEIKQTTLGTITTMAPEVMKKESYGLKADIWSIGIIFFQMVFGIVPYKSTNATLMWCEIESKKILNTDQFQYNGHKASKKVTSFLKQVLTVDKTKRLGWRELIKHPIFSEDTIGHLSNEFRLNYDLKVPEVKINEEIQNNIEENKNQIEIQQILKEKEKPERVSHEVIRMTNVEANQKKRQISNEEDAIYQWVRETHLECLKTQLIFNQIFSVIEQFKLLDSSDRQSIEFMYLLVTRCLNNISIINDKVQHSKSSPILSKLQASVKHLYEKIISAWEKYSAMLTDAQNKIGSIISDRFSKIFKSKSFQTKEYFLTGNEKVCYTKEQQIKFTDEEYIPAIKASLKPQPAKISKEIKNYLSHYVEINLIRLEDIKQRTFEEYVNVILQ